jgi:hypothetical protein
MNRLNSAALLFFAIVACSESPVAPHAGPVPGSSNAVVTNDHFEMVSFNFNYCTGGSVTFQMKWHELFSLTFDNAGGVHFKQHFNLQGQGTDPVTGVTYVSNDVGNFESNSKVGEEDTYTEHYNLIAKGKVPNAYLLIDFHITITPNGDVTSFHDNFRIVCQ